MRLPLSLTALLVFVAAAVPAQTVPRMGTVDVQAVLTTSETGRAARQILEKEKNVYQAEVDASRREIEVLREELDTPGPPVAPDVIEAKRDLLDRKRRDAARLVDARFNALDSHEKVLVRQVLEEMVRAIRDLGREQSYDAIVENRSSKTIYEGAQPPIITETTPTSDLTADVIRRLDARQFVPR